MPPTTKKLLESLSGSLVSVLVWVNIASNALVHLLTESAGYSSKVLLDSLLRNSNNQFHNHLHKLCFILNSLDSHNLSSHGLNKLVHIFSFIECFLFSLLLPIFLISSRSLIILSFFIDIILFISSLLLLLTIIIIITTAITISSTIKHSLLLLKQLLLPLRLSSSMIGFSRISLSSSALITPEFNLFNLEGRDPSVPTIFAGQFKATGLLVIGYGASVFKSNVFGCFIDFVTIIAHASLLLGFLNNQHASNANFSVFLLTFLFSLSSSLSFIIFLAFTGCLSSGGNFFFVRINASSCCCATVFTAIDKYKL